MAQLLPVLHDGEDVGLVELVVGRIGLVGLNAIDEFGLTQEFSAARLCSGATTNGWRYRVRFLERGDVRWLPHA